MACQSCGIEGFVDGVAPDMISQVVSLPKADNGFHQYMKSECNYAAQPCLYTAQGEFICPKEGLGDCGGHKSAEKHPGSFFGLL